jgi:phospho-2-dehydro-3-deoxyheptonate aldolase
MPGSDAHHDKPAQRHPVTADVAAHVSASRRRIEKILNGEDRRLLVILGSQKSVSSPAKMPGSDAHHDKPIPAYCKSRA